jgi:hypothetical protein
VTLPFANAPLDGPLAATLRAGGCPPEMAPADNQGIAGLYWVTRQRVLVSDFDRSVGLFQLGSRGVLRMLWTAMSYPQIMKKLGISQPKKRSPVGACARRLARRR